MSSDAGSIGELRPGSVVRADGWAVGDRGNAAEPDRFAVSRRCRHLGGPLDEGEIDDDGCLVCPWHGATYDVESGEMRRGPQGIFAKVPGLGALFRGVTRVVPLRRGDVEERDGRIVVR